MKRPAISPQMRLQVFRDYGAVVLCQVCGNTQRIADVAIDHHLALIDGGAHEVANLRPLCTICHKPKSATEHKNNAKVKRIKRKHSEPTQPGSIKSRGFQGHKKFNGEAVWRKS